MAAVLGCLAKWRSPGRFLWLIVALCLFSRPSSAATLTLMVNTTEPVTAGGAPRIGMDVGGTMIQGLSVDAQRAKATAKGLRRFVWIIAFIQLWSTAALGATLTLTVTASEPVTITGTPRIAVNVGGFIRYANYAGAQGQAIQALPFTYLIQAGDFDPDGISIDDPQIDLNGATVSDAAGNPLNSLAFTKPNTSSLMIQTYTVDFTSTADLSAISFAVSKAPANATFTWSISSNGGSGTVSGSGTFSGLSQTVSGVNVSGLAAGTLTLSVTAAVGSVSGEARTASATPALAGVFDSMPAAAAMYSVRRLRGAYTGPLLRVRRSSDNGERDIAASFAGTLDQTTLGTFCGTFSCFVSIWYDQGPNGKNALQPTAANQLRIMTGGVIDKNGAGRTALRSLTAYGALNAAAPMATSAEFTILAATETASLAGQWLWAMTKWPGQVSSNCPWGDGNCYFDVGGLSGSVRIFAASGVTAGNPYIATFGNSVSTSTQFLRINGSLLASDGTGHSVALQGLAIMNNIEYSTYVGWPGQVGTISEFIVYPSLLSGAGLQSIEQSMASAFGP